jgi:peptide/nickel transport system substrate-binding protein
MREGMVMIRNVIQATWMAVFALVLFSLFPIPTTAGQGAYPAQIVVASLGDPPTVDPILATAGEAIWRSSMIFDRLVRLNGQTLLPEAQLAERWDVSPDGRTYTVYLRRGVTWHDGKPFTAADVEFTVYLILHPNYTGPHRANWTVLKDAAKVVSGETKTIQSMEVRDSHTLRFVLAEPYSPFVAVSWSTLRPMPKHLLDGVDPKELPKHKFQEQLVGTGPYKFKAWVRGGEFVLEANEKYWGKRPVIKRVVQRIVADSQTQVVSLEAGELDGSLYALPGQAERLKRREFLHVAVAPFRYPEALTFSLKHPALKDKALRQAIVYAVDVETYTKKFLQGLGEPGVGPVAPSMWLNKDLKPHRHDTALAAKVLADGGWKKGADGVLAKDGVRASFVVNTNAGNIMREEFVTFVQSQVKPLGIELQPEFIQWSLLVNKYYSANYDAIFGISPGALADPDELMTLHSKDPRNTNGYSNPRVDQLLAEGRRVADLEARKRAYFEVQKLVMEDVPVWWAWYRPYIDTIKKAYLGPWFKPSVLWDGMLWNLGDWGQQ